MSPTFAAPGAPCALACFSQFLAYASARTTALPMWREPMRVVVSRGIAESLPPSGRIDCILCDPGRVTISHFIGGAALVGRGGRFSDTTATSAKPAPALATTAPQPNTAAAKLTQES